MASQNQIVERITRQKGRTHRMLAPWLRSVPGQLEHAPEKTGPVIPVGLRFKAAARKMRVLNENHNPFIHPEKTASLGVSVRQKYQNARALTHLTPKIERKSASWSEMERVYPQAAGSGEPAAPEEPGVMKRGSIIPRMQPTLDQLIASMPSGAKPEPALNPPPAPKKALERPRIATGSRRFTHVEEITRQKSQPGGAEPALPPENPPSPSHPPTVQRQEERPVEPREVRTVGSREERPSAPVQSAQDLPAPESTLKLAPSDLPTIKAAVPVPTVPHTDEPALPPAPAASQPLSAPAQAAPLPAIPRSEPTQASPTVEMPVHQAPARPEAAQPAPKAALKDNSIPLPPPAHRVSVPVPHRPAVLQGGPSGVVPAPPPAARAKPASKPAVGGLPRALPAPKTASRQTTVHAPANQDRPFMPVLTLVPHSKTSASAVQREPEPQPGPKSTIPVQPDAAEPLARLFQPVQPLQQISAAETSGLSATSDVSPAQAGQPSSAPRAEPPPVLPSALPAEPPAEVAPLSMPLQKSIQQRRQSPKAYTHLAPAFLPLKYPPILPVASLQGPPLILPQKYHRLQASSLSPTRPVNIPVPPPASIFTPLQAASRRGQTSQSAQSTPPGQAISTGQPGALFQPASLALAYPPAAVASPAPSASQGLNPASAPHSTQGPVIQRTLDPLAAAKGAVAQNLPKAGDLGPAVKGAMGLGQGVPGLKAGAKGAAMNALGLGSGASESDPAASAAAASSTQAAPAGNNLEQIAEDVLPIIKRLLEIETTRGGG